MNTAAMVSAAKKYGTPLYVYDEAVLRGQCQKLARHFPGVAMHYAMKANSNPQLLQIIRKEGMNIEAVSIGEIDVALAAGFSPARISFTCSNITEKELTLAAKAGVRVHLDSLTQLAAWGRLKLGREVSLRLNQGIGAGHHQHVITGGPDSKFGISLEDLEEARVLAAGYALRITGLQQHIGSNVLDEKIFLQAVMRLLDTATSFPELTHIDFGGGIGIPYGPGQKELDLKALGKKFRALTHDFSRGQGRPYTFSMEPGRFVVAQAGALLVSVVDSKKTSRHLFVGVNSGFNHLIRPAMYGSYHPIENISAPKRRKQPVSVAGNVCESGDVFAVDRELPMPLIGDTLAILHAGAYGFSMASHYNMRALPKEVLMLASGALKDISFSPAALAQ